MLARNRSSRFSARLSYGGVVLFVLLLAWTAVAVRAAWREQVAQSRAEAVYRLVQGRTPPRPTETPGAAAWLSRALRDLDPGPTDPERAALFREVAQLQGQGAVPRVLAPVARLLAAPPAVPPGSPGAVLLPDEAPSTAEGRAPLRVQRLLALGSERLVLTRRRALDRPALDPARPADQFLALAAPRLMALRDRFAAELSRRPLTALPGARPSPAAPAQAPRPAQPPRIVRLYAVAEDGTLLSLPWVAPGAGPAAAARAVRAEADAFREHPERPTFAANEFFFQLDPSRVTETPYYSGLYLDVGGQGIVGTLLAPLGGLPEGEQAVVSADLAFDIDWGAFAAGLDPPAVVVRLDPAAGGRPATWSDLGAGLATSLAEDRSGGRELRAAVATLAERERAEGPADVVPYVLHGVAGERGAVAAFQVAPGTWLVALFPASRARVPWLPVLLSAGVLALVLAGFERNRRAAEAARRRAEAALAEKQNLLNTMQVPLLVVDPNTDEVVSANRAAAELGIAPGSRVADLVAPEARAREHYVRMQAASPEPRRAYGLPVRLPGEGEDRYAVVRSVAVTAPIEALQADERHRLGILFLLDPEADLSLLTEDLAREARTGERRLLAGLLAHGVDNLARLLAHGLERAGEPGAPPLELTRWLAGYLDRRLHTAAWLLERWDAEGPLPADCVIEVAQARATLERLESIFQLAAADPGLRARLHWENGVLASPPADGGPVFAVALDWPERWSFPCPVRGGFGFFLGEVLVNAVRHGRPGSTPRIAIGLDRVRRELAFEVVNETNDTDEPGSARGEEGAGGSEPRGGPYGGLALLLRLAVLFGWRDVSARREAHPEGDRFCATWRVPVSERGEPFRAD